MLFGFQMHLSRRPQSSGHKRPPCRLVPDSTCILPVLAEDPAVPQNRLTACAPVSPDFSPTEDAVDDMT